MPEINYRVDEGITAHDQSVRACEFDRHVTLRVSGRVNDAQAGDDFIAGLDHLHPVFDGRVVAAGAGDETGALGGQPACRVFASPEVPLR